MLHVGDLKPTTCGRSVAAGRRFTSAESLPPNPETVDMITRRKTSRRLTTAALTLAAALALPTGPASAQHFYHDEPVEEEIVDGRQDRDSNGNWIWCWPLYWFIFCGTR